MEPSRHLVGLGIELAPCVEGGEDRRDRGLTGLLMGGDRDPTTVVADADTAVGEQGHVDACAVPGHRLVDGVVHDLPDEVMEPLGSRGSDVHRWTTPHRFETLEDLNGIGFIRRARGTFGLAHEAPSAPPGDIAPGVDDTAVSIGRWTDKPFIPLGIRAVRHVRPAGGPPSRDRPRTAHR